MPIVLNKLLEYFLGASFFLKNVSIYTLDFEEITSGLPNCGYIFLGLSPLPWCL